MKKIMNKLLPFILISLLFSPLCISEEKKDPAEVTIGERLFLETRFAQAYYANPNKADPAVAKTITVNGAFKSPFAGKTMNCRACHMVDEHAENPSAGMRTYSDYSKRPPVPLRDDGNKTSGRNSMSMVNISLPHHSQNSAIFHFDGQFNSMEDLVLGTFTGRNFGWTVTETEKAKKHIAKIIREDDGKGELAQEFGGAYRKIFNATDNSIASEFILPAEYRLDVTTATDQQILNLVAKLVSVYVTQLTFQIDDNGQYTGSPYDKFLALNNLPRKPLKNESNTAYSKRLLTAVNKLKQPRYLSENAKVNKFISHKQAFKFGNDELKGMKLFFSRAKNEKSGGNCVSCHTAPHFSDFGFHNTGLTQENYDILHGKGSFNKLLIPSLVKRNRNYDEFLPATSKHPNAKSRFRSIAEKSKVGYTDLGLWNVLGNMDIPAPQTKLKNIMCAQAKETNINSCSNSDLLANAIAAFKTPVLRDIEHSNPYLHTGQFSELANVIRVYIRSSELAREKKLRNSEKHIEDIKLEEKDIPYLVSFLKALNEDYE